MAMINARMSARSESRYRAFKWLSKYYFSFLDTMGVQLLAFSSMKTLQ